MNLGKAIAIFNQIESDKYTDAEKMEAIRMTIDMETHNSILKVNVLKALNWLWFHYYAKL